VSDFEKGNGHTNIGPTRGDVFELTVDSWICVYDSWRVLYFVPVGFYARQRKFYMFSERSFGWVCLR